MDGVSIIVLIQNNTEELATLITRVDTVFTSKRIKYEIIFVTSAPNQGVETAVEDLYPNLPLRYYTFEGNSPSHLLAEAVAVAMYSSIGFVTVDQIGSIKYAVDAFAASGGLRPDIVMPNRRYILTKAVHQLVSSAIKYSYGQVPLWMTFDTDAGMRLVKKELLVGMEFTATGPEMNAQFFDQLEARNGTINSYTMSSNGDKASAGKKRNSSLGLAFSRAWQKLTPERYEEFDTAYQIIHGSGFRYRGREYITHNRLPRESTAVERTTPSQRLVLAGLLIILLVGILANGRVLLIAVVSLITILYFFDLLFNMFLIYRSLRRYGEVTITDEALQQRRVWPSYTVLCPLYKEALVVPQFISAMEKINYPKRNLDVLLLLESNDTETLAAIQSMKLPHFFTVVIVPHSLPKTKPKACNYGLLRAKGEYCVIYDAEDIPDPLQLKKAVMAFEQSSASVACIQAKLNYYNWNQNLLTRLFTLEYSLWFNLILTGLQSIKAPIPLGGTSNHFRTAMLRELGGWDPFNVTEDADLGIRLAKRGLTTAILDSVTYEEANSAVGNWLRQRSRWIKGYIQTYLVHMRDVRELGRNGHRIDMLTFQLVIGGKIVSMLVNPTLWVMTIGYFVLRNEIGGFIESLYLTPIFYIGAFALIVGNFLYVYYYMIGSLRQGRPELAMSTVFVPFYWLLMSIAAGLAMYDLIMRPFHWHKTKHGLHLKKVKEGIS